MNLSFPMRLGRRRKKKTMLNAYVQHKFKLAMRCNYDLRRKS